MSRNRPHLPRWWAGSPGTGEPSSRPSAHSGTRRSSCWCPGGGSPAGREPPSPQGDGWSSGPSVARRTPACPPPGAPEPRLFPGTAGLRGTPPKAWRTPWWGQSCCCRAPWPRRAGGGRGWRAGPLWDTASPACPQNSAERSAPHCPAAETTRCQDRENELD